MMVKPVKMVSNTLYCTAYIPFCTVRYVTRGNVSSDFMKTLSSIPNERGFKMAFLNIVSLPKKTDEINNFSCQISSLF
jgi:hypothetical protein